MNRPLTFLLAFCLIVFMASFYSAAINGDSSAYPLSVISFVAFFGLYAVVVLGLKLGGSHISLESKVQSLERKEAELKESVVALLKALYVSNHHKLPMDPNSKQHNYLREKYIAPIRRYIDEDIWHQVDMDVEQSNREKHEAQKTT